MSTQRRSLARRPGSRRDRPRKNELALLTALLKPPAKEEGRPDGDTSGLGKSEDRTTAKEPAGERF